MPIQDFLGLANNFSSSMTLPTFKVEELPGVWSNLQMLDITKPMQSLPQFDWKTLPAGLADALAINQSFVQSELQMMESILRGAAMAHHMEPLYYVALQNSLVVKEGVGIIGAQEAS